jgi:hypothetical protein
MCSKAASGDAAGHDLEAKFCNSQPCTERGEHGGLRAGAGIMRGQRLTTCWKLDGM